MDVGSRKYSGRQYLEYLVYRFKLLLEPLLFRCPPALYCTVEFRQPVWDRREEREGARVLAPNAAAVAAASSSSLSCVRSEESRHHSLLLPRQCCQCIFCSGSLPACNPKFIPLAPSLNSCSVVVVCSASSRSI